MTTAQNPHRFRDYDRDLARRLRTATGPEERDSVIDEILRHYKAPLQAYCRRRFAPDWMAGDDAAAETLSAAWQILREGQEKPQYLRAWIFSVARRRCLDQGRKIGRERARIAHGADAEPSSLRIQHELRLREATAEGCVRERRALALIEAIVRNMPADQQRLYQLHRLQGLSGARLAAELGCTSVQADSRAQRHREALESAFEVNLLARDPSSRNPCGRLSRPVEGEPRRATPCATLTGILSDAVGKRPELRAVLDNPESTVALPYEICRDLERHERSCDTCQASVDHLMLRWAIVVAALLGTGALAGGEGQGMQPVASVAPAAAPPTPGRRADRPPARGWGRRPSAGRNLVVSALGAAALWGGLSIGVLSPAADADHLALLPPSVSVPRDATSPAREVRANGGREPAPAGQPSDRPSAVRVPSPVKPSPARPSQQSTADSSTSRRNDVPETPPKEPPAEPRDPQAPVTPPSPSAAETAENTKAQPPAVPSREDLKPPTARQEPAQVAPNASPTNLATARVWQQTTKPQPPTGKEHPSLSTTPPAQQSGPHSDVARRDPSVLTPKTNTPVGEPG
ncbi:sigma-70 family RNA polymerase sigma factor [Streptomyces abikoensis]|uniref:Sigma-70 family RNA polymerase sigma factor n=1 Tax=Streptomyces abikoensis TaxID=97398 RepID=A0ABW7T924_9ACTN